MCKATVLSANGATTITYCKQCRTHYIWQNSYLLTFNGAQYQRFMARVEERIGREEYFVFPDGEWRTLMQTPLEELIFTFTQEEWENFYNSLQEAAYMHEVYQLLG